MADAGRHRQGHEIGVQEQDMLWKLGEQPKLSAMLWLSHLTGIPFLSPDDDLSQPPSPLAEYPPAPDEPQVGASSIERNI